MRARKKISVGAACVCFACAVSIFSACGRHSLLPPSGGKPFEALVVGDADSLIRNALEADVEGLPQPEPAFDISTAEQADFKQPLTLARNIVTLNINPAAEDIRIRYEKNVYAQPQMIVRITAPSTEVLRKYLSRGAARIRQLLVRAELNARIDYLRHHRNVKAERVIRQMFGVEMMVPMDMTAMKRGRNFLWLSNHAARGMQSICIYTTPKGDPIGLRDSVMRINIPGEMDGMYMSTRQETVGLSRETPNAGSGRSLTVARGLWEMKGDAMGGPFVLHVIDRPDGELLNVEAFVYAPEMKKRNLMRLLEASLYTLN